MRSVHIQQKCGVVNINCNVRTTIFITLMYRQNDFPCQDKEAPLAYRKNNVMLLCKCNKIIKLTPKHPIITHLH